MTPLRTVEGVRDFVADGCVAVQTALESHVARAQGEIPQAGADYRDLWGAVGAQQQGGKNLRPSLTLAAYAGLGGDDAVAAVPVAAAMEMLHTAMLVHDDLLDGDEVRRGRLNVAGRRRRALEGSGLEEARVESHVRTAALLGGDLALSSAYDLIARADLPAHHRLACIDLVTRAVRATIAGELLDMYGDLIAPEEADSVLVAELKTATYSCVVPLLAGAQLAGADPTMISHLERLGASLGLSFQLVDDDLGVFGDPEVTGKSVLSDLRAGKRTELLRLGYERADAAGRAVLEECVGDPELDEERAARVREVLMQSGARKRALVVARRHARTARTIAAERIPAPLSGYLIDLIDGLEERTS
ncbi:polyprenyl synthetase family protein [Demequina mangrovi]|uniref:Geranylgeranyl diphosphate synthase, type II n=1 Tax=Demequina mangrovi TaxID=1043493 RepID=A0A1H6ZTV7_9MICO|nr:polyprenyl synthetase family protein [Demequina mangrovi]SEJ56761.1 geranylgeranyl diphosphate synthase, type II [Demequina mangrovi]